MWNSSDSHGEFDDIPRMNYSAKSTNAVSCGI